MEQNRRGAGWTVRLRAPWGVTAEAHHRFGAFVISRGDQSSPWCLPPECGDRPGAQTTSEQLLRARPLTFWMTAEAERANGPRPVSRCPAGRISGSATKEKHFRWHANGAVTANIGDKGFHGSLKPLSFSRHSLPQSDS